MIEIELTTQVVGLVTAMVVLATAAFSAWAAYMLYKAREELSAARDEVQEVHLLVNDRLDTALAWIEQLKDALRDSGVQIPEKE